MPAEIVPYPDRSSALMVAGQIANDYARQGEFVEYWNTLSGNAQTTRLAGLRLWAEYLSVATDGASCFDAEELRLLPGVWRGTTYGLVKGFKLWMAEQSFSVATINNRLTTVRVYARLAATAGAIPEDEASRIATVKGYSLKAGANLDQGREKTRTGAKKALHVSLTRKQALDLMKQPLDTPQGRRDAVIMTLLLDHGLRVGELAGVESPRVDLTTGMLTFYRPKSKRWATIELTRRTLDAMTAYMEQDAPVMGRLLRASDKSGKLGQAGISERSIQERVAVLGQRAEANGLSPHDCRHYAATFYASKRVDTLRLMEMFGWNSPAMARRYVEESKIANEGTKHLAGGDS